MESEKIIKSIRGPKETFEKLASVAKEQGIDQGAALEALLNCWSIQQAKGEIPGRAADIADFDASIQAVQRAFLRSLELAQGAESRARASYQAQIDVYAGKVAALEAENTRLKTMYKDVNDTYHKVKEKLQDTEERLLEVSEQVQVSKLLEKLAQAQAKAEAQAQAQAQALTQAQAQAKAKIKAKKAKGADEAADEEPTQNAKPDLKIIATA